MFDLRKIYKSSRGKLFIVFVISILVIGVLFVLTIDNNPIPDKIRQDLTFSPFAISKKSGNYKTSNYDTTVVENGSKILSYTLKIVDSGNEVTVTQYVQPVEFTEIPDYKDRFLSNIIKQFDTVQTSNGSIYLGRLSKQNDEQIGIMIEKGLIVFIKPKSDIDKIGWHKLGEQFYIQKTI